MYQIQHDLVIDKITQTPYYMEYMEMYSLAVSTRKIYNSKVKLFSLKTLRDILDVKRDSTFYDVVKRLVKSDVLKKIEKDKYVLTDSDSDYFSIAGFLYRPSYISFETALNYYGVLSQFPYGITCATPKKTVTKVISNKEYLYTHIQKSLYWGYEKKGDFIIACPEKALLDELYIASKGIKSESIDEYDYSRINKSLFRQYLTNFPKTRQFNAKIEKLFKFLKL